MKIVLVGIGAIGSIIASRLAENGLRPTLFVKASARTTIDRDGVTIIENGKSSTYHFELETEAANLTDVDLVICSVKAYSWSGLVPVLEQTGRNTAILPIVNGIPWWYGVGRRSDFAQDERIAAVDPTGEIVGRLGRREIVGAVTYVRGSRTSSAVTVREPGNRFVLGKIDGRPDGRFPQVADLFKRIGFDVEISGDLRHDVWKKLLLNATFNPLSVMCEKSVDVISSDSSLRCAALELMTEVAGVAKSEGYELFQQITPALDANLSLTGFKPSMLQDFEKGTQLETDANLKAVIELGTLRKHPSVRLSQLLQEVEHKVRRRDGHR
jgi:2-dehydropantoate 2-reductase